MSNPYVLTNLICASLIVLSELIFLVFFRPGWKFTKGWWIVLALYAQAVALLGLGLRVIGGVLGVYVYPNHLDFWRAWNLFFTILATCAAVCFVVGYLQGRDWGKPLPSKRMKRRSSDKED